MCPKLVEKSMLEKVEISKTGESIKFTISGQEHRLQKNSTPSILLVALLEVSPLTSDDIKAMLEACSSLYNFTPRCIYRRSEYLQRLEELQLVTQNPSGEYSLTYTGLQLAHLCKMVFHYSCSVPESVFKRVYSYVYPSILFRRHICQSHLSLLPTNWKSCLECYFHNRFIKNMEEKGVVKIETNTRGIVWHPTDSPKSLNSKRIIKR